MVWIKIKTCGTIYRSDALIDTEVRLTCKCRIPPLLTYTSLLLQISVSCGVAYLIMHTATAKSFNESLLKRTLKRSSVRNSIRCCVQNCVDVSVKWITNVPLNFRCHLTCTNNFPCLVYTWVVLMLCNKALVLLCVELIVLELTVFA